MTAGTTSIRAVPEGVELRNGGNRITIYRHQIIPFCDFAIDWAEQQAGQEDEQQ